MRRARAHRHGWWRDHQGRARRADYFRVESREGRAGLGLSRKASMGARGWSRAVPPGCLRKAVKWMLRDVCELASPPFSLLRGASRARGAGRRRQAGLGSRERHIADRNSVAGVVGPYGGKTREGLRLAIGRDWSLPTASPISGPIRADATAWGGSPARSRSAAARRKGAGLHPAARRHVEFRAGSTSCDCAGAESRPRPCKACGAPARGHLAKNR